MELVGADEYQNVKMIQAEGIKAQAQNRAEAEAEKMLAEAKSYE